jgi:mono/diheme cytochrome c family protein
MVAPGSKRVRKARLAAASGALAGWCLLSSAGCELPGRPDPARRPETPRQIVAFDVLFRQNCSGCHGAAGNLGPAPPLNDPLFLAIASDDDLLRVMRAGRRGTPMPAFSRQSGGELTDRQLQALVEGMRAHWKSAPPASAGAPAYALNAPGAAPPGDATRGAALFDRACAECHGADGTGEGGYAGAVNDPAFLSLISNQALRRIVITGRADLGMPNYAQTDGRPDDFKPLSSAEIDDLVALLAAWREGTQVAAHE